jgi:hypothetical protein
MVFAQSLGSVAPNGSFVVPSTGITVLKAVLLLLLKQSWKQQRHEESLAEVV